MTSRRGGAGRSRPTLLTLPPELGAVRSARTFVAQSCVDARLSAERCDEALLLTSELVTNAVLHGRSEVCIEVQLLETGLRVSVFDENSRHPMLVRDDPDALDGRGLLLVQGLARRWGVEDRPLGKAVWFELARA